MRKRVVSGFNPVRPFPAVLDVIIRLPHSLRQPHSSIVLLELQLVSPCAQFLVGRLQGHRPDALLADEVKAALHGPRLPKPKLHIVGEPLVRLPSRRLLLHLAIHGVPDRAPGLHIQARAGPPFKALLALRQHPLRHRRHSHVVRKRVLLFRPLQARLLLRTLELFVTTQKRFWAAEATLSHKHTHATSRLPLVRVFPKSTKSPFICLGLILQRVL